MAKHVCLAGLFCVGNDARDFEVSSLHADLMLNGVWFASERGRHFAECAAS